MTQDIILRFLRNQKSYTNGKYDNPTFQPQG